VYNIRIRGRQIGHDAPVFVVAEAGVNHNGSVDNAIALVRAAHDARADAVKFQSFDPGEVVRGTASKARYQQQTTGAGNQIEMLNGLRLSEREFEAVAEESRRLGIMFLCTPFDAGSVEMLLRLKVPAFKVSSTDITNFPFLRQMAGTGLPMIVSTGASTLAETLVAKSVLEGSGAAGKVAFLHCCSEYPAPVDQTNLLAIGTMRDALRCPVGYSDHTAGIGVAPYAAALGACIIEKHLTLDVNLPGPDHAASLEPRQFADMVAEIRIAESARGDGNKVPMPCEIENRQVIRRALTARRHVSEGEVFTSDNVAIKRPAQGLPPDLFDRVLGSRARRSLQPDEAIEFADVEWKNGQPGQ